MLIENKEKRKLISKWLIGIFTICILIFLSVGHINVIANSLSWLFNLFFPLILGCILALIINVPLGPIENHLFSKTSSIRCQKARRPLAIILSLLLIFGIFIGIAFLIIPELINAIKIVVDSINTAMDQMAVMDENIDWSVIPFGTELSKIDIDWLHLKSQLQQWFGELSNTLINTAISALGSFAGSLIDFIVGGNLAGPVGMLLGVPIASAAYVLLREATDKRELKKMSKTESAS